MRRKSSILTALLLEAMLSPLQLICRDYSKPASRSLSGPTMQIDPIIRACQAADLATLAKLAQLIWQQHYPAIISQAQIDYMLARRYAVPALQAEIGTAGHWLDGLWLAESMRQVRQLFSARRPGSNEARQAVSASGWHGKGWAACCCNMSRRVRASRVAPRCSWR